MIWFTLVDILPFTVYFCLWIIFFAFASVVLRLTIDGDPEEIEYPFVNEIVK